MRIIIFPSFVRNVIFDRKREIYFPLFLFGRRGVLKTFIICQSSFDKRRKFVPISVPRGSRTFSNCQSNFDRRRKSVPISVPWGGLKLSVIVKVLLAEEENLFLFMFWGV